MTQAMDSGFIDTLFEAFHEGDANVASKSEEESNVRRVEEVYRVIARDDFAALGEILADDVVLEIIGPPTSPMTGLHQGRQQVVEVTRNNFAQLEAQRPEIQSVVAQGDTVIVVGREQGRFRPTGRDYKVDWMHQFTFKGGKVARIRELFDSAALLSATEPGG
jgi:ketosteroid isomerase-like protein